MKRRVSAFFLLFALLFSAGAAVAQNVPAQGEYVVVSGGPALRSWEDLRIKRLQHDNWWANFIRPARVRMQEIVRTRPQLRVTWLVYRPAYVTRSREESRPLISYIDSVRTTYGVNLIWFNSKDELINYLNGASGRGLKIVGFEFYGHSNKHAFMFDYSNDVMGASTTWLHERDLRRIRSSSFSPNAFCQSWGCHTGESMSKYWRQALGVPMLGAVGKTDYSPGYKAVLSPGGRWAR